MTGLVIALLVPLVQDATELKWNLKEGQEFTCSWSIHYTVLDYDFRLGLKGTLIVSSAGASGAECEFKVTRLVSTGPEPRSEQLHFENGVLTSPGPASPIAKHFFDGITQPVKLSIGPRGDYDAVASSILEAYFKKGEGTSGFGAIRPDLFGARLPEKPVPPGSTWEVELYGPQHKSANSPAVFKVPYKLESVKGDIARITLDSRQVLEIQPKAHGFKKLTYDLRIQSDSEFNVRAGLCTKWNSRVTAKGGETSGEAVWEVQFEMAEKK
jgi:hypothetical protein